MIILIKFINIKLAIYNDYFFILTHKVNYYGYKFKSFWIMKH